MARLGRRLPAAAACVAALAACAREEFPKPGPVPLRERAQPTGQRVLLVALGGLSLDLLRELAERGDVPVMAELLERGAACSLGPPRSTDGELDWQRVLTGWELDGVGIRSRRRWDVDLGRHRFSEPRDRAVPALWEVAAAAGRRVLVAGLDLTTPPDAIDGVIVGDAFTGRPLRDMGLFPAEPAAGPLVQPPELAAELEPLLREPLEIPDEELSELGPLPPALLAESRATHPIPGNAGSTLRAAWAAQRNVERVTLHLVERRELDLVAVGLCAFAVAGAPLWHHLRPEEFPGVAADERLAGALRALLRHTDGFVGRLRDALGPDCAVILVSAYGLQAWHDILPARIPPGAFAPLYPGGAPADLEIALTGVPLERGLLLVSGGPFRPVEELRGGALDVLPTAAAVLGVPVAWDLPGSPLVRALDPAFLRDPGVRRVGTYDAGVPRRSPQLDRLP